MDQHDLCGWSWSPVSCFPVSATAESITELNSLCRDICSSVATRSGSHSLFQCPQDSSHACLFARILLLSTPSQCPLDSHIHAAEHSALLSLYPSFLPTPSHLSWTDCGVILSNPFYLLVLLTFFLCTPAEREDIHTGCFLYTSQPFLSISAPSLE